MGQPVFISYARRASRKDAEALHQALGDKDGLAFLDSTDIELGERFPPEIADALLASRVVVLFASEDYFRRWYCLWELETVLSPFLALPVPELHPLPAALRAGNWPTADETGSITKLVRESLSQAHTTLRERLEAAGHSAVMLRTRLLEESALPPPGNLATIRRAPRSLPPSLDESFVGRTDDLWRIHYALSVRRGPRSRAHCREWEDSARRAWRWSTCIAWVRGTTREGCSGWTRR